MNSPQPGWYVDPKNSLEERLWDGDAWTDLTRTRKPDAPTAPPQPNPSENPSWPVPTMPNSWPQPGWSTGAPQTPTQWSTPVAPGGWVPPRETPLNGLAVSSLVLSLVPFLLPFIGAVIAVVFGHIALAQTSHPGPDGRIPRGRGMALAGTIIGWVEVVIFLAVLATLEP